MKYKHLKDFLDTKKLNIKLRYNTDEEDEEEVNKYVLKNLMILGVLTKEEIEEIEKKALKEVQEVNTNTKEQQTQEQKVPSFSGHDLLNLILGKQHYEKLDDVIKQGKEMFETAFKDEKFSKIRKESEELIKKINSRFNEDKKLNLRIEEDEQVYNNIKNIIFEKLSSPLKWEIQETLAGTRLTYLGNDISLILVLFKFEEMSTIHIHGNNDQLELSTKTYYDPALENAILNVIARETENKVTKRTENFFS